MTMTKELEVIRRFEKTIESLERVRAQPENIGLDIQRVEELTVVDFKSRGFSKPAKVRDAKKVHFEKLDFEAPTLDAVIPLYKDIVKQLKMKDRPKRSRLSRIESILGKLAPYGSWAALAYTWLHNGGFI